jgi:hypothetical protein
MRRRRLIDIEHEKGGIEKNIVESGEKERGSWPAVSCAVVV